MLKKINEKIFYLPNQIEGDQPILGLVCGEKDSLIIDAGNSINHAKDFLEKISHLNIAQPKYMVLTHHHLDHTLGISEYDLITISSQTTANIIRRNQNQNIKLIYQEEIKIDLGGITCIIKEVTNPHADGATIIYIPEEKVIFLGDTIYCKASKGKTYYEKEKVFKYIETIKQYDALYYVISHEEIYDKDKINSFFNNLHDLEKLVDEETTIADAINKYYYLYNRKPTADDEFILNCYINSYHL